MKFVYFTETKSMMYKIYVFVVDALDIESFFLEFCEN